MGKINWDEFDDDIAFLSDDYYKEKKTWKSLRFGIPGDKRNNTLWKN